MRDKELEHQRLVVRLTQDSQLVCQCSCFLQNLFNILDTDGDGFVTIVRALRTRNTLSTTYYSVFRQGDIVDQLKYMKPPITASEASDLMTEITGGRYGELARPDDFYSWVERTEMLGDLLIPHQKAH